MKHCVKKTEMNNATQSFISSIARTKNLLKFATNIYGYKNENNYRHNNTIIYIRYCIGTGRYEIYDLQLSWKNQRGKRSEKQY